MAALATAHMPYPLRMVFATQLQYSNQVHAALWQLLVFELSSGVHPPPSAAAALQAPGYSKACSARYPGQGWWQGGESDETMLRSASRRIPVLISHTVTVLC